MTGLGYNRNDPRDDNAIACVGVGIAVATLYFAPWLLIMARVF